MNEVIEIKPRKGCTGEGDYGSFFKIDKGIGVKVLTQDFDTLEELLKSKTWEYARNEATMLEAAFCTGIVPECYGPAPVLRRGKYYAGIVMQALGRTTLYRRCMAEDHEESVKDTLKSILSDHGFIHKDLHANNIMWYRRKYWAIDFDSRRVEVMKKLEAA